MKKLALLLGFLAFIASLTGLIIYLVKLVERKRGLFYDDCEDDDYDVMLGSDQNYYDEDLSDLSPDSQGNTAPIKNAEAPAGAMPQEH
jgi:hypothetical protein